jgi:molecular chaperone HscB
LLGKVLKDDFFSLFGLPVRFDVDQASLDEAYRTVQSQAHPDRFANAGDAERRVAMQWAAHANEAYRTLRQPLKRAIYLLTLRGVDIQAENNTAMAPGSGGRPRNGPARRPAARPAPGTARAPGGARRAARCRQQ